MTQAAEVKGQKKGKSPPPIYDASDSICAWVAFREYNPAKDPMINCLTTTLTGSAICHVEIIFQKPCTRQKRCPYAYKTCVGRARDAHLVAYSVQKAHEHFPGVYQELDRKYSAEGVWTFRKLHRSTVQLRKMEQFLVWHSRNSAGYNRFGFYLNFLTPFEIGCTFDWSRMDDDAVRRHMFTPRKWFCSELLSVALLAGGLAMPSMPCKTSPAMLYYYCLQHTEHDDNYSVVEAEV